MRTRNLPLRMTRILTKGVRTKRLSYAGSEMCPGCRGDKGCGQQHINVENLDNSEPSTNMGVANSYKHQYYTVHMHCLFGGGANIRIVDWPNLVPSCQGRCNPLTKLGPASLSSRHATIYSASSWAATNIRAQYVSR